MAQKEFLFPGSDQPEDSPARGTHRQSQPARAPESTLRPPLPRIYSITQLTRLIKITLAQHLPAKVVVEGEISNFKRHGSGHLYLTLKDENAQVPAVMWRTAAARLKFQPTDGRAVVATGRVDVYERQGKYQLYLDKLEPAGFGALELAYRQLADKLRREGLFEERHKKPLPPLPGTIAIVTSDTGAAIEDIRKTLRRRFAIVRQLLYPVAVQGEAAAGEIARALGQLNRRQDEFGGIDLIILARGGGSLEDLWAFNEEIVARAIFASEIPLITGIGHESDTTIADLIADRRAATPTAAAELAVPVLDEIRQAVLQSQRRLAQALQSRCELAQQRLGALGSRGLFVRPLEMVRQPQQLLDEQNARLKHCLIDTLRRAAARLEQDAAVLGRIEPHAALAGARGRMTEQRHLLYTSVREYLQGRRHELHNCSVRLRAVSPLRRSREQQTIVAHNADRLVRAQQQLHRQHRQQLDHLAQRLENLNPRAVLHRGYSITRLKDSDRIVTAANPPGLGDLLTTELAHEITVESKVTKPAKKSPRRKNDNERKNDAR